MQIQLISVPYDSGYRGMRMGRGPLHFVQRGLPDILTSSGHDVQFEQIESQAAFRTEVTTAFELNRLITERVRASADRFPLVLAGNCNTTLGVLSGMDTASTGLVWFDAHGDYNTPETSPSGFLDGMGLAVITGQCWRPLAATVAGFKPLPGTHIVHVGGRDLDAEEAVNMQRDGLALIPPERITDEGAEQAVTPIFDLLRNTVDRIHIHLDLDVLDPAVAQANHYATSGGLNVEQIKTVLSQIAQHFSISSAVISAYDPDYDNEDRTLNAGIELIQTILKLAA